MQNLNTLTNCALVIDSWNRGVVSPAGCSTCERLRPRPYTPFAWRGAGAGRGDADSTGRCSAREGHLTRTPVSLPGGCSTCARPRPYTPFARRGAGAGRGDAWPTWWRGQHRTLPCLRRSPHAKTLCHSVCELHVGVSSSRAGPVRSLAGHTSITPFPPVRACICLLISAAFPPAALGGFMVSQMFGVSTS